MFEGEKAGWDSLFKYYQDRFQEEIGISFGCVENKKYLCEIDFFVGEKTQRILGMKLYQEIPTKKKKRKKKKDDSEMVYYDFALSEKVGIGKLLFKEIIEKPGNIIEDDTEKKAQTELIEVKVFSVDGTGDSNISYVTINLKDFPDKIIYFSDASYN